MPGADFEGASNPVGAVDIVCYALGAEARAVQERQRLRVEPNDLAIEPGCLVAHERHDHRRDLVWLCAVESMGAVGLTP
jgi:hypothetical protein